MDREQFKELMHHLGTLTDARRYVDALRLVDELLVQSPASVALLLKRAILIQLQDATTDLPPLESARESLERAIEFEPDSIAAHLELGNYLYAVADDPSSALEHFEQAIRHAEFGLHAAFVGLTKCQMELDRREEAANTLKRASSVFPDDSDISMLEDELNE